MTLVLGITACAVLFALFGVLRQRADCGGSCGACAGHCERRPAANGEDS